jgi:hypothetical protein
MKTINIKAAFAATTVTAISLAFLQVVLPIHALVTAAV